VLELDDVAGRGADDLLILRHLTLGLQLFYVSVSLRGASGGEERSDEWKVVSYVCRQYVDFAVALLQPLLLTSARFLGSEISST